MNSRDFSIVVIGDAGTGKSSFVNLVSGATLEVADGLRPVSRHVVSAEDFELDGHKVRLIDTPGLNVVERPSDILHGVAAVCTSSPAGLSHPRVDGVIYLHRISNPKPTLLDKHFLKSLCGRHNQQNVVIVTNMWNEYIGSESREELVNKTAFQRTLGQDVKNIDHDDTLGSAQRIIRSIFGGRAPAPQQPTRGGNVSATDGCRCFGF